ncbi:hypothetical protein [Steroidobacter sp.]|uniref:hypothetical protein n=1 Tax=Steroidobacter sp. TaxID=1978227 RepID=UPI001A54DF6A|nr:hypothetical protein [Steroidobacter sp.]MBL8266838.1 hypothetical protein [Steroidobacter sp.]
MLSVDLWNLFGPLLGGSLALFGCALIYWSCQRAGQSKELPFLEWFRVGLWDLMRPPVDEAEEKKGATAARSDSLHTLLLFPLFACAIFGLGVVLDSAVDDFVDGEPTAAAPIRWVAAAGLPRENDLRFSAMFERVTQPEKKFWWREAREMVPLNFGSVAYSCVDQWPEVARGRVVIEPSGLGDELLWSREGYAHFLDLTEAPATPSTKFEHRRALSRQALWCPGALLLADQTNKLSHETMSSCPTLEQVKFDYAVDDKDWGRRCKLAMHIARKYYYDASNYTRRSVELSAELNRWQAQKGLLGATHLVCMTVALVLLVRLVATPRNWPRRSSARVWLLLALLGAWFSAYGFTISSRNYIERTLGIYASSLHHDSKLKVRSGERAMRAECERLRREQPGLAAADPHFWSMTCRDLLTEPSDNTGTEAAAVKPVGPAAADTADPS